MIMKYDYKYGYKTVQEICQYLFIYRKLLDSLGFINDKYR